jgi:hypothetical protein
MPMSPEQVAKEFVANLENDQIVKYKFLTANYQNSIWLQCPPYQGEPVDFWQYGPPIPNAPGYIYLLAETWYHGGWGGWIIRFPSQPTKNGTYEFEEAKKVIEMKVAEKWGSVNVINHGDQFKTIIAVKWGTPLIHPDWALGVAARDIEPNEIIEYSSSKSTNDVFLKWSANANAP